jgi:hypothetical protein
MKLFTSQPGPPIQVQPSSHNVDTSQGAVGGKHQVGQDAFPAKNTGFPVRDR